MLMTADTVTLNLKAKLFRGFGDASRLHILTVLREKPLAVNEIVALTGLSQPNVSNHLNCLKDCGLVLAEQTGRYMVYRLSDDRVDQLITIVETLLADVAKGVYECTRYDNATVEPKPGD